MKKKVVKVCNCGKHLTLEDTQYIGVQHGQKKEKGKIVDVTLHLFNCAFCRTTLVIHGIK